MNVGKGMQSIVELSDCEYRMAIVCVGCSEVHEATGSEVRIPSPGRRGPEMKPLQIRIEVIPFPFGRVTLTAHGVSNSIRHPQRQFRPRSEHWHIKCRICPVYISICRLPIVATGHIETARHHWSEDPQASCISHPSVWWGLPVEQPDTVCPPELALVAELLTCSASFSRSRSIIADVERGQIRLRVQQAFRQPHSEYLVNIGPGYDQQGSINQTRGRRFELCHCK